MTDDLAGILKLLDNVAGKVKPISAGDLISIGEGNTISVNEDIPDDYEGTIGIDDSGSVRKLVKKEMSIINENEDGDVMVTIWIGNKPLMVKALPEPEPEPEPTERYIVSEDHEDDIVLSGDDDGVFLDYWEPEQIEEEIIIPTPDS